MEKDFFISAVPLVDIDGTTNIPTALYYQSNTKALIGNAIFNEVEERVKINQDFKIDLGYIDPISIKNKRKFETAAGVKKSSIQLTTDFFYLLYDNLEVYFDRYGIEKPDSLLISEPLSLQSDMAPKDWLSMYRKNLTGILSGQKFGFKNIDFLPEPFAVFQYYRYGLKHPVLYQQAKQNALVIDFGGGTFDVCVIETTKEGDVRIRGKSSKPLAASSVAVGGFYVNRKIAEFLLLKYITKTLSKKKIRSSFKAYNEWINGVRDLSEFEEIKNFMINFHNLIYEIEIAKIALCKSITNWDPNCLQDVAVPISIPENPFILNDKAIDGRLTSQDFYNVFLNDIWMPHLKPNIDRALKRAKEELKGGNITVILLSGGSANIGWLRWLIKQDFDTQLHDIDIFPLPNYQEVVAQGLAIECARRFFTEDKKGDFSSITYNRICLLLNPNEEGFQIKNFKAKEKKFPDLQKYPGVLLPSASFLNEYLNKPIIWKVKLSKSPTRKLEYKFLRSSLDADDLENLMNIESTTVYTPGKIKFDSYIQIELTVKENATAYPKFIYKTGPNDEILECVEGNPFPIDLTTFQSIFSNAYLGIDFGTSNSSVAYVNANSIEIYNKRKADPGWEDLASLVDKLPFTLSVCLAEYIRQIDTQLIVPIALEYLEAVFTLCAYVSYIEYCCYKNPDKSSQIFKGFTQRSIGPLWSLFKECYKKISKNTIFFSSFEEFFQPENCAVFDDCVEKLAKYKHGKISGEEINHVNPIQLASNICFKAFKENIFGHFEEVKKKKFSKECTGKFRKAHGRLPFIETYNYEGQESYSDEEPAILNLSYGKCLFLEPLLFWDKCEKHSTLNEGHCFVYDNYDKRKNSFSFKASGFECSIFANENNKYSEFARFLNKMKKEDPNLEVYDAGNFCKIDLK